MKGITVGDNSFKIYVDKLDQNRIGKKEPFEKIFEKVLGGKAEIVFG